MKNFSKIEIAAIKRTAQNVATFVTKKEKIDAKIAELEAEKASLQPMIDAFQGPIKDMTGGYTTEDLVQREVVKTGKLDPKTGKEVVSIRYTLKYPETVVPPTADAAGSDYDIDRDKAQLEAEADNYPEPMFPDTIEEIVPQRDRDEMNEERSAEDDDDPWA